MSIRPVVCVAILALSAGVAWAVVPPKAFTAQYSGPAGFYDNGMAVAVDAAGNIYSASEPSTGTGSQIVVVKYSPTGLQQWVYSYAGRPGGGSDRPFSIAIDSFGTSAPSATALAHFGFTADNVVARATQLLEHAR